MRLFRIYRFLIGRQTTYDPYREIIHRFLQENGLTHGRFMYSICGRKSSDKLSDCNAALRQVLPEIGEARNAFGVFFGSWFASNMDDDKPMPEERLYALLPQIHREYFVNEASLLYGDVDFFGRVIPSELRGEMRNDWRNCLYGSGIALDAPFVKAAALELRIEVLRDGVVLDASAYARAMQQLLPDVPMETEMTALLTDEEQQRVAQANEAAAETLKQSEAFLRAHMPDLEWIPPDQERSSVSAATMKLAGEHGWEFWPGHHDDFVGCGIRTARGNVLHLAPQHKPLHMYCKAYITYQGCGFSCRLGVFRFCPADQAHMEDVLDRIMRAVEAYRDTLLDTLDAFYPESPEGFEPVLPRREM